MTYYPFGMEMPARTFSSPLYRYGFNGKEKDDEAKGSGAQFDYGFRIYDPRVSRFLSVDPLQVKYSDLTPYHFVAGNPVNFIDADGKDTIRFTRSTTFVPIKYGLGGEKYGGGYRTSFTANIIKAPGEDKFFYDVKNTTYQANGNPITGIVSKEFFPNSRGVDAKATGITYTNLGIGGEVADDDNRSLAKIASPELVNYLISKDPKKYEGLKSAQAFLALEKGIDEAHDVVTNIALLGEGSISLYKAGSVTRSLENLSSLRGATWEEAKSLIPEDWIKGPMKKGDGIKFVNPAKKGEQILLEKGWEGAKDPLHSGPYMKISRNGKIDRIPLAGNPTLKKK